MRMDKVQDKAPTLTAEQHAWLDDNLTRQSARHEQIVADMAALSQQREEWINSFLARIQNLGFNYNCDLKRKIPEAETPEQPDRPYKVVY